MEEITIETVLQYFLTQGPFAALFVWLLIYVMKANQEREMRLQNLLEKFSEKYDDVIDELKDIKDRLPPR
ncbi:BhlA holin family protein [Thalassobacillus cyri]|uniref:BhlA holin family protein n=1 Tax=Thalassobacillus cyri TaxID=571932 RepID=A0A1H4C1R4_9BACI|nr:BhlA holin family protein [Thalassobacillus cyri]